MKLSQLLYKMYDATLYTDVDITGLALDSRKVKAGDLFFAYGGSQLNGRHYIDDAIKNGAVAVVTEAESESETFRLQDNVPIFPVHDIQQKIGELAARFHDYPAKKLKVIGVTGTNGKTSCAHLIAQTLHYLNIPCAVVGTLGNGLYGDMEESHMTTPNAIELHALFAKFMKKHAQYVAMEVSSHSLDQGRVHGVEFAAAIFTNLTRDHLDYHGTMAAYGAAKEKLFTSESTQNAVINIDDEFGQHLVKQLQDKKDVVTYSIGEKAANVYAKKIDLNLSGIRADIVTPWGKGQLIAPLIGQFNLSNLLAVLSTLCLLEISFESVLDSFAKLSPVDGRMQMLGGGKQPLVVVDYSHTPDALEKALIALRAHCEKKLYCVFGCGGDRDRGKRPIMANVAEKYADFVILTDDNPRTEDPEQIFTEIIQGFAEPSKITVQHDRSKAIRDVIQCAQSGDAILIAGKGAEMYQVIGIDKISFSDVEKVKESLDHASLVK